ncbi:DUF4252 domain-containing protein [Chryseobacterium sp.]|uniref:DUF4252 domain-containing protein n=1 Tax=Chryseobacterium sp. TaxID=1871047 RepID=UPI002FC6D458
MKKIFIICALVLSHFFNVYGQKNKLDQLFDKYQETEGVTSIKIAKPMFGMLSNLNIADSELDQIKPLLSKIDGLKILITENTKGNLANVNKEISSYLNNLNYNEIMSVKNAGSKVKFLSSEAKNDGTLDNMLLSIDSGGGENILVMLDGKISMDDVNKILNSSETKTSTTRTTVTNSFASENTSSYLNGESRNVGEFSKIDVSLGINVNFKQENTSSVKVLADADKLQHVITKVDNGILKIYIDNKKEKNLKFKNLTVNVSSPKLNMIKASTGATFTTVNTLNENNLEVNVESGGSVKGTFSISETANVEANSGGDVKADLRTQKFILNNTSGASVRLEGLAKSAVMNVNSGASCKADAFVINTAQAECTSGASLSLYVKDKLKVNASSGGSVRLKGNPDLESRIDKVSGGSLKQIN